MLKKLVINNTEEDIIIESGIRKIISTTKQTLEYLEKNNPECVANIQRCKQETETAENLIKRLYAAQ